MKTKFSVGLDVGNRRINMVKLARDPQGLGLLDFASASLNPKGGREEKLSKLKQMAQEKGFSGLPLIIGVSGESVVVRYVDLPKMSEKEVGRALKYEAQQYIPFKLEEVIFDFHILKSPSAGINRMKVLLVAAKRSVITEFIQLTHQALLKPSLIDVNSFSLINCFVACGPQVKKDDVYALVNLELDLVNMDILQGETPFFTRDISLLEDVLSLRQGPLEQVEAGFFEAIRPVLANLIREIHLSIDYFESEFEKQVCAVYISGEGAGAPELISFFKSQLGREVIPWNPVQNLPVNPQQVNTDELKKTSCTLALACGLALRGAN